MLANFHTHTTFCDGKNTPEEMVLSAIQKGFSTIGFSGHGTTPFDLRYCMKDVVGYQKEITRLKEKYKNDIQIYLGLEEDAFSLVNRAEFDYILGSSHYFCVDGTYYPVDSGPDYFRKWLAVFDRDVSRIAETYYQTFCDYIRTRKPDIIGHFDLITKFDETEEALFLHNDTYKQIAEKYITEAAKSGSIFEVNTGAIWRGLRTTPYPSEDLLHVLKKLDARVILSSDCHFADALDFGFEEAKRLLRDIGFTHTVTLYNGEFSKVCI